MLRLLSYLFIFAMTVAASPTMGLKAADPAEPASSTPGQKT